MYLHIWVFCYFILLYRVLYFLKWYLFRFYIYSLLINTCLLETTHTYQSDLLLTFTRYIQETILRILYFSYEVPFKTVSCTYMMDLIENREKWREHVWRVGLGVEDNKRVEVVGHGRREVVIDPTGTQDLGETGMYVSRPSWSLQVHPSKI